MCERGYSGPSGSSSRDDVPHVEPRARARSGCAGSPPRRPPAAAARPIQPTVSSSAPSHDQHGGLDRAEHDQVRRQLDRDPAEQPAEEAEPAARRAAARWPRRPARSGRGRGAARRSAPQPPRALRQRATSARPSLITMSSLSEVVSNAKASRPSRSPASQIRVVIVCFGSAIFEKRTASRLSRVGSSGQAFWIVGHAR